MNIQIFYIVVDLRDTHTLIKLNQSFEWKLHSKYTEIFKKIKNGDLILFSKKSHYSWNIIL